MNPADALKDFSKEEILCPPSKSKRNSKENNDSQASASSDKKESKDGTSAQDFGSMFSEEGLAKMAEEFSRSFQNMPEDDLKLLTNLGQHAADLPADSGRQTLRVNIERRVPPSLQ